MTLRALIVAATLCFALPLHAQDETQTRQLLQERNQEFEQEIIQVSKNVYTAVGYGLSTVSMIVGEDGVVIVDTNLDPAAGAAVMTEFRKITDLPVRAIIFTHGHGDHTGGARAFLEESTQVWARTPFNVENNTFAEAGLQSVLRLRGFRQFGVLVPEEGIHHVGITPRYFPSPQTLADNAEGPVGPTHVFQGDAARLEIAGFEIQLIAADGETHDQLFVWFGREKVLFSGDNFYSSWPNLYAIRGTAYRDVRAWIDSLSAMLEKNPHHLVSGHTRPISGEANVAEVLTNYRDALEYVFDKTIEGIELGLTPDQLVQYAQLPDHFRELEYLRPYYGHPDWGVRSIFSGYLGWFDGNPTNLFPLPPRENAQRMVELAGGRQEVEAAIEQAVSEGNFQWALQLSDYLRELYPQDRDLMLSRADLLDARAQQVLTVTARNYYRSVAFELRQQAQEPAPSN